ncbi:hypothetical protein OHR68_20635 [Spirillospora sp. NBC_00431]
MPIQEPQDAFGLWALVKPHVQWPDTNEDVTKMMSQGWTNGRTHLAAAILDIKRAGSAATASWQDTAGQNYSAKLQDTVRLNGIEAQMDDMVTRTTEFTTAIIDTKNEIVHTININAPLFGQAITLAAPNGQPAVDEVAQEYVTQISAYLNAFIDSKAAAVTSRGDVAPPPPLSGDGKLTPGEAIADMVSKSVNGQGTPAEFEAGLRLLQDATDIAGRGDLLEPDQAALLNDFYNELGEDLWRVDDYIAGQPGWNATDPVSGPGGLDGGQAPARDWMRSALGTGIITLSNLGEQPRSLHHLPQTVRDLVDKPAVTSAGPATPDQVKPWTEVERIDHFEDLAGFLHAAPSAMVASTGFSERLTVRVAEIASAARQANTTGGAPSVSLENRPGLPAALQSLLDVTTRNEESNHRLLTDRLGDYKAFPDALHEVPTTRALLDSLYRYGWSDRGSAVAGLTDWIAEQPEDPRADEAAASLIDKVTSTERGEGANPGDLARNPPDGSQPVIYDELMKSLSRQQDSEIARSFGRIAANYLDEFSSDFSPVTEADQRGSIDMTAHDGIRFLDLIATDDAALKHLAVRVGAFEQELLQGTLDKRFDPATGSWVETTPTVHMATAGQKSAYLDALLAAASMNAENVARAHEFESPTSDDSRFRAIVRPAIELGKWGLDRRVPIIGDILKWEANRLQPQLEAAPTGPIGQEASTQAALDYMRFVQRTEGLPADESAILDRISNNVAELGNEDSDWLTGTALKKPGFESYLTMYNQYTTYFRDFSIDDTEEIKRHREGLDGYENKPPR